MTSFLRLRRPDATSLALALIAGLGYALFIEVSRFLAGASESAYPVWLSEGFALGFWYVTRGQVRWPQIPALFLGSLGYALWTGWPAEISYAVSVINALQLTGAAGFLAWVQTRFSGEGRGLPRFLALTVGVATVVNGICAAMSAGLFAFLGINTFVEAWLRFFVSDGLGILLVSPLMASWLTGDERKFEPIRGWRRLEFVIMLSALSALSAVIFSQRPDAFGLVPPLFYLVVPLMLWAAVRFGLRGSAVALVVCSLIAIYYTMVDLGPFVSGYIPTKSAMIHLQGFLLVVAISVLFANALMFERKVALSEAREMEHRYEAAIKASENLVFEIRFPEQSFTWAGDVPAVLGWQPHEINTVTAWSQRIHAEDLGRVVKARNALLDGSQSASNLEYRVARPDGRYVLLGVSAYGRADPRSVPGARDRVKTIVGIVKDITAKRTEEDARLKLEAELRQAQKMEAIGQLAGGIAHDFNNILASILGYGELAKQKVAADSTVARYLETMMKAGERGRILVAQILTFSRRTPSHRVAVDVADALDEVVTLVKGSNPHEINFESPRDHQPTIVIGDATELHQLFMNLVTNAVQAMPTGGAIKVTLAPVELEQALTVAQDQLPAGRYLRVSVADRGVGIDADTQARMFEPFYTTKAIGKGTGLGLAMALSIARAHKGGIAVDSVVGQGTTFHVYLPHVDGETSVAPSAAGVSMPRGNGERVLLVDDETPLRELAEEILVDLGYEVASFGNSLDALAAFEHNPDGFDAVLSDEVMPGMTGTELAGRVNALRPRIPIIIITAYGGAGFELRAQEAGVLRVLKKPYQPRVLADALKNALMIP